MNLSSSPELENKNDWIEKVKVNNYVNLGSYGYGGKHHNTCLYTAPENIKKDRDVNIAAALHGQEFLWNIDNIFTSDKSFILELIQNQYKEYIYESLTGELKHDPEIFFKCLERKDRFFWGISEQLLDNKEAMLEAVQKYDISKLSKKLLEHYALDKEFLEIYLEKNPNYYPSLKKRMSNYFGHVKRKDFLLKIFSASDKSSFYKSLPEHFKEDLDFVHVLLDNSPYNLSYLPENLQKDIGFVTYCVNKYGCSLRHIPNEFLEHKELAEIILEKDGSLLPSLNKWKNDPHMLALAFKTCKDISIVPKHLLQNKEIVMQFLEADPKNANKLLKPDRNSYAELYNYNNDIDVMRIAVAYNASLLEISDKLKNNQELCELAIAASGKIEYLSPTMLKNRALVIQLLSNNVENCDKACKNSNFLSLYNNDQQIAEIIITHYPENIYHFPELRANKKSVLFALEKGLKNIKNIDSSLYSDKEIATQIVIKDRDAYMYLPYHMRSDRDVALTSLSNHHNYHEIIQQSNLHSDLDFHKKVIDYSAFIFHHIPDNATLKKDLRLALHYIEVAKDKDTHFKIPEFLQEKYGNIEVDKMIANIRVELLETVLDDKQVRTQKLKI